MSDTEYFHHEVKLVDLHTKRVFYDKLTFVYLEMPKFNKTEDELETMFDKWLFVLRNLSSLLERLGGSHGNYRDAELYLKETAQNGIFQVNVRIHKGS